MRYRMIEEYCPMRGRSWYWTQRRVLGLWWWPVDGSLSGDKDEARTRFARVVSLGSKRRYFVAHETPHE